MTPEAAFEHIRHGALTGRLGQAYVLAGAPGGGAGRLAESVLQLFFCEAHERPCGACRACRQAAAHTHADLQWVEPQKKSRIISIEQVRDMGRRVFQTSFTGRGRACVLVGADRLGPQASNAFLKMLEEPPPDSLFLLLTEQPQALLPTVSSRCRMLTLSDPPPDLVGPWREEMVSIMSKRPAGDGAGLSVLPAMARAAAVARLLRAVREAAAEEETARAAEDALDEERETLEARISARYREGRGRVLLFLLRWYRDMLCLRSGGSPAFLHHRDCLTAIAAGARGLSHREAMRNVGAVEAMARQLARNLPDEQVLKAGFSRLTR